MTQLYYLHLYTPSADKMDLVVEASSPEEALKVAQDYAIECGDMDEEDLDDPENSEIEFSAPELIKERTGEAGIRLHFQ